MSKLSIHTFMHVPFEGLGCIENWITVNNHSASYTKFYEPADLPKLADIDWLIIMGGPMSVHDEVEFPWLINEKRFIREAIEMGKAVIGICLGSQLIAEVLGSEIFPNKQKEIGWFDIQVTETGKSTAICEKFDTKFKAFHWHGETYNLPSGARHLFRSQACENQGFLYKEKVLGIQFHFEVTDKSLKAMLEGGESELIENETVQSAEKILNNSGFIENSNKMMFQILDKIAKS
jgi:GMP synthase-like glutamine amidotransferase